MWKGTELKKRERGSWRSEEGKGKYSKALIWPSEPSVIALVCFLPLSHWGIQSYSGKAGGVREGSGNCNEVNNYGHEQVLLRMFLYFKERGKSLLPLHGFPRPYLRHSLQGNCLESEACEDVWYIQGGNSVSGDSLRLNYWGGGEWSNSLKGKATKILRIWREETLRWLLGKLFSLIDEIPFCNCHRIIGCFKRYTCSHNVLERDVAGCTHKQQSY